MTTTNPKGKAMATMTSLAPIEVHPRETAITLCLEISREIFNLSEKTLPKSWNTPEYNAWFIVRRTAECVKESSSLKLSRKHSEELDAALFTYHLLSCPNHTVDHDGCECPPASLIQRLLLVIERS
jgi:hypothetical protein